MNSAISSTELLLAAAGGLFWIGMLGLLWRRSLVGMLIGLMLAWVSVAVAVIGFILIQGGPEDSVAGGALVLCVAVICSLETSIGLCVVVARIRRRGTLDADEAGLLEG